MAKSKAFYVEEVVKLIKQNEKKLTVSFLKDVHDEIKDLLE